MKRAVSVSLGSSVRDKQVVVNFGSQPLSVERIGTDGDVERARRLCSSRWNNSGKQPANWGTAPTRK